MQREAYDLPIDYLDDDKFADELGQAVEDAMTYSERSQMAANHRIGVSDIGHCREYARRLIKQEPFTDQGGDQMAAFVGTAFGDLLDKQLAKEGWTTQHTVIVPLQVGNYQLNLPGHVDMFSTERDRIVDDKTKNRLSMISRMGPNLKEKFQPTLYAHGLIEAGLLTKNCTVSLAYFDRSAADGPKPLVYSWKYDEGIVAAALEWLDDVFEALALDEEASRDKERDFCYTYCPFATTCRGEDTDVEGLLADPEILAAIEQAVEAKADKKDAEGRVKAAEAVLKGINGRSPDYIVRQTSVGETFMKEHWRKGYTRINISRARPKPKGKS